jgi:peroxiredoxin
MFCRARLAQLEQHHAALKAAGLNLIAVGLGEPKYAQHFCGKLAPNVTCLTDNTDISRDVYGLNRTAFQHLATGEFMKAVVQTSLSGHLQGKATGNTRMLPGTFIVDRTGVIRYAHYSVHPGDEPPFEDLIAGAKADRVS